MATNSKLLDYVINLAKETREKNSGESEVTASYFVLCVLRTLKLEEDVSCPDELKSDEVKTETEAIRLLLGKYEFNIDEAIAALDEGVRGSDYSSFSDSIMFYQAKTKATLGATNGILDTAMLMKSLLENPSKLVKQHVARVTEEPKPVGLTPEQLASVGKKLDASVPVTDTAKQSDNGQSATDITEKNQMPAAALASIVNRTRNIQRTLLESVYGQDHAVNALVSGYFQAQLMETARPGKGKPQATFLFAGPPGVGKTFLAEKSAEALGLPYKRFDMSEYSDKEAAIEFCGSDNVYKNAKAGNVTGFVAKNPKCVLLFDEIEKAHISVIYLFLQILDAGRIRDNHSDEEVSFSDAVIIFTTNVGKNLYDDPTIVNLSALPKKKVLKALAADVDPVTRAPLFPAAICSRFASGNVVMFNHLEANNLYTIAKRELENNVKGLEESAGIEIKVDDKVASAIMFSEGGKADARTVKGRANAFFHEELYELFRLMAATGGDGAVEGLKRINITVPTHDLTPDIAALFESGEQPEVLIFAEGDMAVACEQKLSGQLGCHVAHTIAEAKEILFNHDISVVLCDVSCGAEDSDLKVLNAEDIVSVGHDFLVYVLDRYSLPVYILQSKEGDISPEELLSFAKLGVRDVLTVKGKGTTFAKQVLAKCTVAHQQSNMIKLARENKALSYKTSQILSKDKRTASINLFDFRLSLITDTEDSKSILDNVSRPNNHFDDVIGAEDAKSELKYFVEYLKNPIKYMRQGVRSPKGVLLYGPPGTGKTLLAKAMAGESGVTFLRAEGNEFLKRYIGEGAEAVHALFHAARKYAPAIVFIDEIDAIGKNRDNLGSQDHTSDVLTALLTEMDGFHTDTSKPVFVLAATNYGVDSEKGKSLDAALLRRFDRRIYVDLPNKDERKRYLQMKLSKHASAGLSAEQLENIAMRSTGMSLAELESVFEMALRSAIRSESGRVGDAEFEEAFETFTSGEKKEWNPDTLMRVARHEAGHALLYWLSGEKPSYITVVARGDHGGYMQHANSEDKQIYTRTELLGKIRTALGGRAAEMVYYGTEEGVSTGASGDLYSATATAERMICSYGMEQDVGMSYIDAGALSGAMGQDVRERVNAMLAEQLDIAVRAIEANKAALDAMVDALMVKNHLKEKEIDDIFTATVTVTDIH